METILDALRAQMPRLRQQYKVRALALFGSRVLGHADGDSDLDILVDFEEAPTFFQFIALEDELSEMLHVKVDLVMKSALRPRIGRQILSEVKLV